MVEQSSTVAQAESVNHLTEASRTDRLTDRLTRLEPARLYGAQNWIGSMPHEPLNGYKAREGNNQEA